MILTIQLVRQKRNYNGESRQCVKPTGAFRPVGLKASQHGPHHVSALAKPHSQKTKARNPKPNKTPNPHTDSCETLQNAKGLMKKPFRLLRNVCKNIMYTYTYTLTYIYIYISTCVYTYTCIYIYIYILLILLVLECMGAPEHPASA